MKILFRDVIQESDAPPECKTPALTETAAVPGEIIFDDSFPVNSIGIGNTDGTFFLITFNDDNDTSFHIDFSQNGLYCMKDIVDMSTMEIETDATFVGRIAAGIGVNIPTAIAKEPGFASTSEPRQTLSGQIIQGAGGYNYRTLSLDSRYKIDMFAMSEIKAGYKEIGLGYPFFIDLSCESYKLPFERMYATEQNQRQMSFEGGVRRFLYSRRWFFREAF